MRELLRHGVEAATIQHKIYKLIPEPRKMIHVLRAMGDRIDLNKNGSKGWTVLLLICKFDTEAREKETIATKAAPLLLEHGAVIDDITVDHVLSPFRAPYSGWRDPSLALRQILGEPRLDQRRWARNMCDAFYRYCIHYGSDDRSGRVCLLISFSRLCHTGSKLFLGYVCRTIGR
jgi:hypothetical protein